MTAARLLGVAVILVSTTAEATGQLSFKRATRRAAGVSAVAAAFGNWPWLVLGLAGFAGDGLLWSKALGLLDVSVAHPIGSLVFVVTAVLSRALLGERITRRRWVGIGLILVGSATVAVG